MSSISFGGTFSFTSATSSGWIIGYDNDGVLKQKDVNGLKTPFTSGLGEANYLPKWLNNSTLTKSTIVDNGTHLFTNSPIGLGGWVNTEKLYVNGNTTLNGTISVSGNSFLKNTDVDGTLNAIYINTSSIGYLYPVNNINALNLKITNYSGISGSVLSSYDTNGNARWKTLQELNVTTASGVVDYIPIFSSSTNLSNSNIYKNGSEIQINGPLSYNDGLFASQTYSFSVSGNTYLGGSVSLDINSTLRATNVSFNGITYLNRLKVNGFGMGAESGKVLSSIDSNGEVSWKTLQELNPYGLTGTSLYYGPNIYSIPMFSGTLYQKQLIDSPLVYYSSSKELSTGITTGITFSSERLISNYLQLYQPGMQDGQYLRCDSNGNATWTSLPGGLTGSGVSNYTPRWTTSNILSSTSSIYDDGQFVSIGLTNNSGYKLHVNGDVYINSTQSWYPGHLITSDFYTTNYYTEINQITNDNSNYRSARLYLESSDVNIGQMAKLEYNTDSTSNYLNIRGYGVEIYSGDIYGTSSAIYMEPQLFSYYSDNCSFKNVEWGSDWRFINNPYYTTNLRNFKIEGTSSTNFFVSGTNNNIGIGTENPSYKLEVIGTVSASSYNVNGNTGWTGTFSTGENQVVTVDNGIIISVI